MLSESQIDNINNTLAESLQEIAFLFSEILYDDVPELKSFEGYGVSLSYRGDTSGEFQLIVSEGLLYLLAENLLGVEPTDPESKNIGLKALQETLNIFMGNYLTREYGVQKVFDLGIPNPLEVEQWNTNNQENQVWLLVEDEYVCITFRELD